MTRVEFTTRASTGPLDSPLGAELRKIEARITEGEGKSIEARWEFGRELLRQRKGKQLPSGLLAAVAAEHHISRSEIKYRIQFAETFPNREQVANALATLPTWRQVIRSFPKPERKRPAGNVVGLRLEFKQWRTRLTEIKAQAAELSEADLRELDRIQDAIADIYTARQNTATPTTPRKRTSK